MIPLKQKNVRVFAGGIQKALCETALTEYAEGNGVVRIFKAYNYHKTNGTEDTEPIRN